MNRNVRTAISFALALGFALPAAAREDAPAPAAGSPAGGAAGVTCTAHMLERGGPLRGDWPSRHRGGEISAEVTVGFDLDGSGRATNLRVLASTHDGDFDAMTLGMIERTRFAPDRVVEGCVETITHTRTRRRRVG